MITKDNLKPLLKQLGFEESNDIFTKTINEATLTVDFKQQKIIYPEKEGLKINERQTCNFSSNENFVVFECVHRLLEKGISPNTLSLNPNGNSDKEQVVGVLIFSLKTKQINHY